MKKMSTFAALASTALIGSTAFACSGCSLISTENSGASAVVVTNTQQNQASAALAQVLAQPQNDTAA